MNKTQEDTPQERYDALVEQFVITKGWSKRKARRYLDAYARRENARIIREGKARQEKLKEQGKLIDTSDLTKQLDEEFQKQLDEQGITLDEHSYKPITNDF